MSIASRSLSINQQQTTAYIGDLLTELARMAERADQPLLAHLIEMATLHAREVAGQKPNVGRSGTRAAACKVP